MNLKRALKAAAASGLALSIMAVSGVCAFAKEPAKTLQTTETAAATEQASVAFPAKISEIFPDQNLAAVMADAMGKTVDTEVTEDELVSVGWIDGNNKDIYSLEGMQYVKRASVVDLCNNHITDLSPMKNFESVSQPYSLRLYGQTITLPAVQAVNGKVSVKNPVIGKTGGPCIPLSVSDGGLYNIFNNTVNYKNLAGESGQVTYQCSDWFDTHLGFKFDVTVTQPYFA